LAGVPFVIDRFQFGEIELKNIVFRYPTKKDVTVAKNINLKIICCFIKLKIFGIKID
jgi:ABC-type multidrug transport system fused ATPase/permease subunit